MRHVSSLRLPLLALALAAALAPAVALAQPTPVPRVIVLRFEGWRSSTARDAVLREIASYVELVDEEQAVVAAQEIGVDVSTPEGMAQVVEHLGISLVIAGSVEGRRRRAETVIIVVDPQGEEVARRTGPGPLRRGDRQAIGQAAIEAIQEAQSVIEQRQQAAMAPPEPEEPAAPMMAREDPEPTEPAETVGWRQPLMTALIGLRLRNAGSYVRDASANLHFFEADVYPEIDVYAIFRPLAEADDASRGLILGLQGSFSVGIAYVRAAGNQAGMTSLRFRADVGYGHVVGDVVELAGMVGFGVEGVQLDDPDGFPSTLYSFLRPGVMARFRAVPSLLTIEAGVGGRIGLDAGPLAGAYGGLFFGGVDLFAGLSGIVEPGFSWAARFGYTYMELDFDGVTGGSLGNGISGLDENIEVRLLLGWSL